MPDMDGYEFVEIIKSHPDTVFIPTILSLQVMNKNICLPMI
jgi:CheY-like chemotaxis protein